jgi:quercetin dioxygenase-like cupin family protein
MTYVPTSVSPLTFDATGVLGAQVPMACEELEPTLAFFLSLGFRIEAIFPADRPSTAIISGHGLQLRLAREAQGGASVLELLCADPALVSAGSATLVAPNGAIVKLVAADPPMTQPMARPSLAITLAGIDDHWSMGRAGLRYRDLLPDRWGGAFIASHIRILEGGPVPDYVHSHKIRFQTIFCRRGWVRVVYEGQGDAFVMNAGDCVLQPPTIRHRVLESSAGAEVIELAAPAQHITIADHALSLPSLELQPDRDFSGQRFVRHIASEALWLPWRIEGFEARDTGIADATRGLASVRVVRLSGSISALPRHSRTEFCFYFLLHGAVTVDLAQASHALRADDSFAIPGDIAHGFSNASADLEFLEVTLPA